MYIRTYMYIPSIYVYKTIQYTYIYVYGIIVTGIACGEGENVMAGFSLPSIIPLIFRYVMTTSYMRYVCIRFCLRSRVNRLRASVCV